MTPSDKVLEFPCTFPIKAMGKADNGFEAAVTDLVRRHAPEVRRQDVRVQPSRAGTYVSVTVTVRATSQAQLDAIYRDLTASERVLMAL